MKKIYITYVSIMFALVVFALTYPDTSNAQMMRFGTSTTSTDQGETAKEEAMGKTISEKLRANDIRCGDLSESDYELMGEYYMGLMTGNAHASMNKMMEQASGKEFEVQMHTALGKRISGCDTNAQFPASYSNFMNMMGVWSQGVNYRNFGNANFPMSMMGYLGVPVVGFGGTFLMTILSVLFIGIFLIGLYSLFAWLSRRSRKNNSKL